MNPNYSKAKRKFELLRKRLQSMTPQLLPNAERHLAVIKYAVRVQLTREAQEQMQTTFREMVLELREEFDKLRREIREDVEREKQQKNSPKPHSHRKRIVK